MRPPDKHASYSCVGTRLPATRSDPHGIKATSPKNVKEKRNCSGPTEFPATGSRFIHGKRLHRWQSHSSPIPPALIVSACGQRHAEYRAKILSIHAIRRSTKVRPIPVSARPWLRSRLEVPRHLRQTRRHTPRQTARWRAFFRRSSCAKQKFPRPRNECVARSRFGSTERGWNPRRRSRQLQTQLCELTRFVRNLMPIGVRIHPRLVPTPADCCRVVRYRRPTQALSNSRVP